MTPPSRYGAVLAKKREVQPENMIKKKATQLPLK
jgi:hypothetical protein